MASTEKIASIAERRMYQNAREYQQVKREIADLEARKARLAESLRNDMDDGSERIELGDLTVVQTVSYTDQVDLEQLRALNPALVERCTRRNRRTTLRVVGA